MGSLGGLHFTTAHYQVSSSFPDDIVTDVGEKEENDVPDKMQVLESISERKLLEDLMNESSEALEPENVSSNLRRESSYQKMFRVMLREMSAQDEMEEDIEIPLTGSLKSETRRKLWILLKKNFEKCKEVILCILKKRERVHKNLGIPFSEGHQGDGKIILYPTGVVFQILFPDGTGQIYYPSGNLAMLILGTFAEKFTYIILEDTESMWVRALINNSGHATFYDENRAIWLSLSQNLGYYFTRGCSPKAWNWWDLNLHIHAPPVQPITLMINRYIRVLIWSQDQILFSFLSPANWIRLNLGTKYKQVTGEVLREMKKASVWEPEAHSTVQKIQILLGKMSKTLGRTPIHNLETFVGDARALLEKGFLKGDRW
ncbi:glutamate-rich protein 6B [Echinops telfairi]|uniref:Glutamate-rich protein 6B n=1 Tax=Echinops telfairi TaxID=9371 RepID=A0ABM0ZQU7_ECHTE|nr:glutamate-rich protein 6B [Echinops telfairi]